MTNKAVNTLHPEYKDAIKRWQLTRAIVNNCAKHLIRKPDSNDEARNSQYREDAVLTNFTRLTKIGLTGLLFRKDPEMSLPPELSYLEDDFTGAGVNALQFAKKMTGEIWDTGRYGLLGDFHDDNKKAYIKPYCAESIINWKVRMVNGVVQPWLIVLQEQVVKESGDEFCQDTVAQYRVLRLDDADLYYQEIYDEDLNLKNTLIITDYKSNRFNYIPFVFVGSENNDWVVDYDHLYDIAILNRSHYQNSADLQESCWINGQPYLHIDIGEQSQEDFNDANPGGVTYGSRRALVTSGGGQVSLLQASANTLVGQVMKETLEQAAAIGARLISPAGAGRETAEAAKIRYGSQHSALYTLAENLEDAIERVLVIACQFMGASPESIEFELNDEYYDEVADANLLTQMILLSDRGIISVDDIREYGRKTGFIDMSRTDEEIDQEVDLINPLADAITNDNQERNIASSSVADEANKESS